LNIDEINQDVQKLLKDCHFYLESLPEKQVESCIKMYEITWDKLYFMVEQFVLEHSYDILFFKICQDNKQKDAVIGDIIETCKDASSI
jgi:hypothetical protein